MSQYIVYMTRNGFDVAYNTQSGMVIVHEHGEKLPRFFAPLPGVAMRLKVRLHEDSNPVLWSFPHHEGKSVVVLETDHIMLRDAKTFCNSMLTWGTIELQHEKATAHSMMGGEIPLKAAEWLFGVTGFVKAWNFNVARINMNSKIILNNLRDMIKDDPYHAEQYNEEIRMLEYEIAGSREIPE